MTFVLILLLVFVSSYLLCWAHCIHCVLDHLSSNFSGEGLSWSELGLDSLLQQYFMESLRRRICLEHNNMPSVQLRTEISRGLPVSCLLHYLFPKSLELKVNELLNIRVQLQDEGLKPNQLQCISRTRTVIPPTLSVSSEETLSPPIDFPPLLLSKLSLSPRDTGSLHQIFTNSRGSMLKINFEEPSQGEVSLLPRFDAAWTHILCSSSVLQSQWRVGMTKCIDASPLVLGLASFPIAPLANGAQNQSSSNPGLAFTDCVVFSVDHSGLVICSGLETGKVVWRTQLPTRVEASPVLYVDGKSRQTCVLIGNKLLLVCLFVFGDNTKSTSCICMFIC